MTLLAGSVTTANVTAPRVNPSVSGAAPSAHERLTTLLDEGSFVERLAGSDRGVVSGFGRVDGTPVAVYAMEPSVLGGALGAAGCRRIVDAVSLGTERGWPVVGLYHSGGARLQEGAGSLDGVGRVFAAIVAASGLVPQVSVVLGPCAGGAAYGPALTDVVIVAPQGRLFVTGPDVIRSVTGEVVDMERLGGPEPHGRRSGVSHLSADSETDALLQARRVVSLLGAPGGSWASTIGPDEGLRALLPDTNRRAYDVRPVVARILDRETALELQPGWAPNMTTTLGRLGGRTVGVVANNPIRLGGCLDAASAEKAARFVRMCDALGVPLVVLVDVPGYLPGVEQEWDGVLRRGAKLLHAFAQCAVPRVTVITRKAFGGALIAMNSRSLGATAVYAWPEAEIDVMGAEAAVGILHKRRLAAAPEDARPGLAATLAEDHRRLSGSAAQAAALGVIDGVLDPAQTRAVLLAELSVAPDRRGRAGLIPL